MLNINELWIGDKVIITESNLVGTFEGINKNGKAEIKVDGKINLFSGADLKEYREEVESFEFEFLDEEINQAPKIKNYKSKLKSEIDLHIQILSPENTNSHPATIIEIQIEALQKFIQDSIAKSARTVTIIHGKGEGKLKEYVHQYLDSIPQTKWKVLTNKNGATEVWFEYLR